MKMSKYDLEDFCQHYEEKVAEAVDFLRKRIHLQPKFAVVLGSGLGDLAGAINRYDEIPYPEIPNFPTPTVEGHEGTLIVGNLEGVEVIGLKGRKHYYEVADLSRNAGMLQVAFPVHVLAGLYVQNYFVTNAAGGLNQKYNVGDVMLIKSHINGIPNPLLGRKNNFLRVDTGKPVERFQPMNGAYDKPLRDLLYEASGEDSNHVHKGVYLAVTGPSYETEAECIAFHDGSGADAVGMSTTPEVIVARNRGMKVVGMSCITNKIATDGTNATNHEEVTATLNKPETSERLSGIVQNFFALYRERMINK